MIENKKNGNRKLAGLLLARSWAILFALLVTQNFSAEFACAQDKTSDSDSLPAGSQPTVKLAGPRTTITYCKVGGQELRAEFQRPASDEVLPVILFVHGGAWVTGSRMHFMAHANQIVSAGFAIFSIDYRLAPRYKFPAPLEDVREALKYVSKNSEQLKIDPKKIVIWGYSAGAQLAALAALQSVDNVPRPAICIAGGTPADLTDLPENSTAFAAIFGATRKEKPDIYRDASPVTFVSSDDPPVFVYQGDQDMLVAKKYADEFYEKLKSANVPVEYYVCEGQGHIVAFLSGRPVTQALQFIHRTIDVQK